MYYYEDDTTIRGDYIEEVLGQIGEDFDNFITAAFEEEDLTDTFEMIKTVAYSENTAPLQTFIEKIYERACEMAENYAGLLYVDDESEIPDDEEEEE